MFGCFVPVVLFKRRTYHIFTLLVLNILHPSVTTCFTFHIPNSYSLPQLTATQHYAMPEKNHLRQRLIWWKQWLETGSSTTTFCAHVAVSQNSSKPRVAFSPLIKITVCCRSAAWASGNVSTTVMKPAKWIIHVLHWLKKKLLHSSTASDGYVFLT